MLPVDARLRGMELTFEEPLYSPDPVYLRDRDGRTLREWRYIPSLGEVDDACREIMGKGV